MYNNERYNSFDDNYHGRRNVRNAIDSVLRKSFMLDAFHLQRINTGFKDYDKKTCYDRTIPLVLLLVYLKRITIQDVCVLCSLTL